MLTGNVITTYSFRHPVSAVCFSPDGKYLAVAKNHCIMVFLAPEPSRSINSLELYRFLYGFQDKIKNIDWSSDSKFIIAGSEDMTARVLSVRRHPKLIIYTLSGHKAPVYSAFVADESLDCVTVSVDGEIRLWSCDSTLRDLDNAASLETKKALFKLTSKKLKIIVTAFESGIIMLHQLPEFILIDKAKLMADPVSSVAINSSGDWIAVGSEEHGQLAVWEWRSKSCHLRVSSHANEMTSITFSPDGLLLATAGRDAKVKIWQVASGRALVTFSDHQAPVTQVAFPATKPKVVISSSLDGTVRAFDLTRYRNFRTMSVPNRGVQLSSLAADPLGELAAAGALDAFDAYVWSVKTGLLLTVLTGHTAPVSSLEFNPGLEFYGRLELVTASWDGTVRTWNLADCEAAIASKDVAGGTLTEVFTLPTDAICTTYRHDGHELAVALLNATILFFDTSDGRQLGSIEGRHDLDVAQVGVDDLVTPHRAAKERKFLSITYSADGDHLLAGGDSKYICLYSVPDRLLLKRFEVTINMSLQGVQEAHDRRKFLSAYSAEAAAAKEEGREALPLPGVRTGDDHSRRWWRPDVRVTSVRFSPTGDAFAATATEGVFVYALETAGLGSSLLGGVQNWLFDASGVDEESTPSNARNLLAEGNLAAALDIALRLRLHDLLEEVIEAVPYSQVNYLARNLPLSLVIRSLVPFLARQLEPGRSRHAAFYVGWADAVLQVHAGALRSSLSSVARPRSKLQLSTATDEQAEERLKQPGVLLEHGEWRAFQASLVRLQSSLDSLKGNLLNRLEAVDAVWAYLSAVSNIAKATELPSPAAMEGAMELSPAKAIKRPISNATPDVEFSFKPSERQGGLEATTEKKRKKKTTKKGNLQHGLKTSASDGKTRLKKVATKRKKDSKRQPVAVAT
ncbi:hypothetical protein AAHC03_0651 [Spirometra sp. Aus1]